MRRFTYDSLSRLLTAKNPESGTITYLYDDDGELLQKTSPAPNQTGAATQTVSYCYDELHRVTGKGLRGAELSAGNARCHVRLRFRRERQRPSDLDDRPGRNSDLQRMTFWDG